MPASVSPPSAVNRTTASAPEPQRLLDLADLHDLGPLAVGAADADSNIASDVVGANPGARSGSCPCSS